MLSNQQKRRVVPLVVLLVFLATVPGPVAAETRVGASVVVPADDVVRGDLTTAAGTVLVLGTVDGDVTALAGDVVVSGAVTGDLTAFAGQVEVTGEVGGTVTAFGGVARVDGDVSGDLNAIVGGTDVGGRIGGDTDVVGVFVDVRQGAQIAGRLETSAVQTQVNGTVLGAGLRTTQNGPATNESARNASVAPVSDGSSAASRGGEVTPPGSDSSRTAIARQGFGVGSVALQLLPGRGGIFQLGFFETYSLLVNLLLGVILLWLLPRFSERVASLGIERPVQVGVYGLGLLLLGPAVLLVLALSLFGFPLALAGALLLAIAAWVGSIYGRFAVGTGALLALTRGLEALEVTPPPLENRWLRLLVGYVVVGLLIRVPFVGVVFDTVVLALGLGALAYLSSEAYRRSERGPALIRRTATPSDDQ